MDSGRTTAREDSDAGEGGGGAAAFAAGFVGGFKASTVEGAPQLVFDLPGLCFYPESFDSDAHSPLPSSPSAPAVLFRSGVVPSWVLLAACWATWTREAATWAAVVVVVVACGSALASTAAVLVAVCWAVVAACQTASSAAQGSGSRQTPTCKPWAALPGGETCRGFRRCRVLGVCWVGFWRGGRLVRRVTGV